MFGLGVMEIVIILAVALIFIGPKKLPELAKSLGRGIREFQNAAKGITSSITDPEPEAEIENESIEQVESQKSEETDHKTQK